MIILALLNALYSGKRNRAVCPNAWDHVELEGHALTSSKLVLHLAAGYKFVVVFRAERSGYACSITLLLFPVQFSSTVWQ
jgi:hypothetical protein